ncbi:MAG: hypothetical protein M1834_006245 [Cirrosporium novae-zelandiae]|nr:MAG: hypothetical protein M1834_006245 [Cirrosporium novae-zelandiae]
MPKSSEPSEPPESSNYAEASAQPVHGRLITEDLLDTANQALCVGNIYKAFQTYTHVLRTKSPGHLAALLNRALAFVHLGYPELAASDAYRACVIIEHLIDAKAYYTQRFHRDITNYIKLETTARIDNACWAEKFEYDGVGPGPIMLGINPSKCNKNNMEPVLACFQVRALYRLAYSLWKCGGGAISDAIGLIEDSLWLFAPECDVESLKRLAVNIQLDYKQILENEGSIENVFHNDNQTGSYDDISKLDMRKKMLLKKTLVRRVVYPWNEHELDLAKIEVVESIGRELKDAINDCEVKSTTMGPSKPPRLSLYAARDFYPGELLLNEKSKIQVVTPILSNRNFMYCDYCSALCILPLGEEDSISPPSSPPSLSSTPVKDHSTLSQETSQPTSSEISGNEPENLYSTSLSSHTSPASTDPPSPPSHKWSPPLIALNKCFTKCDDCAKKDITLFCSVVCHDRSRHEYHRQLCNNRIISDIRDYAFYPSSIDPDNSLSYKQQVYEQLLVKVFAVALEKSLHPLEVNEIRWQHGDLHHPPNPNHTSPGDPKPPSLDTSYSYMLTLPWSFSTNIVRPMKALEKMGLNPFTQIFSYDGWVINTIFAKLYTGAVIHRGGPKHITLYDLCGYSNQDLSRGNVKKDWGDYWDKEVWIGCLVRTAGMVGKSKEGVKVGSDGEVEINDDGDNTRGAGWVVANVTIRDRKEVKVGSDDEMEINDDDGDRTRGEGWVANVMIRDRKEVMCIAGSIIEEEKSEEEKSTVGDGEGGIEMKDAEPAIRKGEMLVK